MSALRLYWTLLRWDIVRELRRREIVLNMTLFAVLILFLMQIGLAHDKVLASTLGPVLLWVTILFTGTVGLSQSFAGERESGRLVGLQLAPLDLGVLYFAKVTAAWIYVMLMEVLVLGAYILLFNFNRWDLLGSILLVMAVFTLGYIAAGVVLSAMTTALRGGGELILRVLLLPLMIPVLYLTLRVSETVFDTVVAGGALGTPLELGTWLAIVGPVDLIYLTTGFLVFPKILEE